MTIKLINTDVNVRELSFSVAKPVAVASPSLRRGVRACPIKLSRSAALDMNVVLGSSDDDQVLRWLMASPDVLRLIKKKAVSILDSRVPEPQPEPQPAPEAPPAPASVPDPDPAPSVAKEAVSAPDAATSTAEQVDELVKAAEAAAAREIETPSSEWTTERLRQYCKDRKIPHEGLEKNQLLRAIRAVKV